MEMRQAGWNSGGGRITVLGQPSGPSPPSRPGVPGHLQQREPRAQSPAYLAMGRRGTGLMGVKSPRGPGRQSPTHERRGSRWRPGGQGTSNLLAVNWGSSEHLWPLLPGLFQPDVNRRDTCTHLG